VSARSSFILGLGISLSAALQGSLNPASARQVHPVLVVGEYREMVHRSLRLLERVFSSAPGSRCAKYFQGKGWQTSGGLWNGTTLVIFTNQPFSGPEVWAQASNEAPWSVMYLNPDRLAARGSTPLDECSLASVILHELGHLARKDANDNEPTEFFQACRVHCINPGRWR